MHLLKKKEMLQNMQNYLCNSLSNKMLQMQGVCLIDQYLAEFFVSYLFIMIEYVYKSHNSTKQYTTTKDNHIL